MENFTAIDFETAQGYRWSICQVGLIRVEQGLITNEINGIIDIFNGFSWTLFSNGHF